MENANADSNPTPVLEPRNNRVFRVGPYIVADRHRGLFPHRCVLTNAPVVWPNFELRHTVGPKHMNAMSRYFNSAYKGAGVAVGITAAAPVAIVGAAIMLASLKDVRTRIGLNAEKQDNVRRQKLITFLLMWIVAPLTFFAFCVLAIAIDPEHERTWFAKIGLLSLFGTSFIAGIGGAIWYAISTRPALKLAGVDETFVWLEGASPKFLATLPELTSEDLMPVAANHSR